MLASPVAGCGLVLCGLAVVPCSEVSAAFGVLVLGEVLVAAGPERDLAHLIALLAEHYKLFLGTLRRALWLVESSELLAAELNLS